MHLATMYNILYSDYRVCCSRVQFFVQFFVHEVNKTFPVYSYAHARQPGSTGLGALKSLSQCLQDRQAVCLSVCLPVRLPVCCRRHHHRLWSTVACLVSFVGNCLGLCDRFCLSVKFAQQIMRLVACRVEQQRGRETERETE